jgi:hypothetical protein
MENIKRKAEPSVKKLLGADEDTLLEQLGMRAQAAQAGVPGAAEYDPVITYDVQEMGSLDDLRDLGRRLLHRWSRELHHIACGSMDDDKKDRESIIMALGLGDVAIAATISSVLVTSFAVAPAVATVIAALVVKRIIEPAGETICEHWDELLKRE